MSLVTEDSLLQPVLLDNLTRKIAVLPSLRFLVAFSGGVDSTVLLDLLHTLSKKNKNICLRVIHINHGLQTDAKQWQNLAKNKCERLQIEFICQEINFPKQTKIGIEAEARRLRYAAFAEVIQPGECLLTAHHAEDQAETVLLQAMRGAGIDGLAAMPASAQLFSQGWQARPMLDFNKQDIIAYAKLKNLQWSEDKSNQNINFTRNLLRQKVLPQLTAHRSGLIKNLNRVAENMAEAKQILNNLAAEDFILAAVLGHEKQLKLKPLLALDKARQRLLIRYWLRSLGCQLPSRKNMLQLQNYFLSASEDADPIFLCADYQLRRYQQVLFLLPRNFQELSRTKITWDGSYDLEINGADQTVTTEWFPCREIREHFANSPVTIGFRQGGEKYRPQINSSKQALKKKMQQWKIPPWERNRTPLIYCGDNLVAVIGYWKMSA